jgi:hypothetical protein
MTSLIFSFFIPKKDLIIVPPGGIKGCKAIDVQ